MTIILKPEQEKLLIEATNSGLARTPDEALSLVRVGARVDPSWQLEVGQSASPTVGVEPHIVFPGG